MGVVLDITTRHILKANASEPPELDAAECAKQTAILVSAADAMRGWSERLPRDSEWRDAFVKCRGMLLDEIADASDAS